MSEDDRATRAARAKALVNIAELFYSTLQTRYRLVEKTPATAEDTKRCCI
jgi:hypothetical protein